MTTDTNDAAKATGGFYKAEHYVWWESTTGDVRACDIETGQEFAVPNLRGHLVDETSTTHAEARAILGDKWPANWPQGEGAVESTTAPATGNAVAGVHSNASSPDLEERTADASGVFDAFKPVDKLPVSIRCCTCGIDGMANTLKLATQDATIRELREAVEVLAKRIAVATNSDGDGDMVFRADEMRSILTQGYYGTDDNTNPIATAAIARARET